MTARSDDPREPFQIDGPEMAHVEKPVGNRLGERLFHNMKP